MSYPNDAPAAAWYPDPQTPGQVRWWDGTNWTQHVSVPAPAAGSASSTQSATIETAVPETAVPEITVPESSTAEADPHAAPAYIGRHAAGAQPAPRREPTAPRIRPRLRVELTVQEPALQYVYA